MSLSQLKMSLLLRDVEWDRVFLQVLCLIIIRILLEKAGEMLKQREPQPPQPPRLSTVLDAEDDEKEKDVFTLENAIEIS
jgi:hypothetical protein